MLTDLGRGVLALGILAYVVGWILGAVPVYPVGIGLIVAALAALVWVRALATPVAFARRLDDGARVDGEDVSVELDVEVTGPLPPGSLAAVERVERLGEQHVELARDGRRFTGRYVVRDVPRGRYPIEQVRIAVGDPFGLASREVRLGTPSAILVYPRLVDLAALFTDSGRRLTDGRRLLLRRASGFDLHSVREHVRGETLRRVHWPSTARRGRLMVKELEDAPRDESVVILDAQGATFAAGERETPFEVAIRAAGSLAKAQAARGRRVGLLLNDAARSYQGVHTLEGDWGRALELLACAEADGRRPLAALLQDGAASQAQALDLVVVTWNLEPRLVERLVQRSAGRRGTALVYVDPASFAGGEQPLEARAHLARLGRTGVPVTVVRVGDDLAESLSLPGHGAVAGAEPVEVARAG